MGASVAAGLSAALAFSSLAATPAFAASAPAAPAPDSTEVSVDDAVFAWSLNKETGNRSYSGAYNFLSAGSIAKTDASDTITETEWLATDGNVTIEKPDADGNYSTATWAGTKTDPTGATITSPSSGKYTGNRVSISGGTGYYDPATDSAEIQWDGDFTVAYYGGLTQFTVSDPFLSVTGGYGVVLGTLSGYGTSMDDPDAFTELPAKEAQIATFNAPVDVTADGIVLNLDYAGVQLTLPEGATAQTTSGDAWGAFPQDFVDYQFGTGQSSYWYSSGGAADAGKVAQPITIAFPESDPDPGTGEPGTGDTVVDGAQLEWAYSRYAQYGVFGAWSMDASGAKVSTGTANGKDISGLDADASKDFNLVRFDGGEGSLDPETGAGTISWADTGDWVLNAYNGQYGAPDETLRDPILTIAEDGTGDLSFEAYIPAGLDMSGNQAPAAGPTRIAIATFSSVTMEDGVITVVPDYAGRSFSTTVGSPWAECGGAGGSWPTAWIDFLPTSVQAHYYTTSCSGLNLMKPPVAFTVALEASAAAITAQPADSSVDAGQTATFAVTASGNPVAYQWQRSADGETWTDIEGATDSKVEIATVPADDGASIRALINGTLASDTATLSVHTEAPTVLYNGEDLVTYEGSFASLGAYASGIPEPTKQWQVSRDGGTTWENTGDPVGASQTLDLVPTTADDGLLARAVFSNGVGDDVTSEPQKLTVVAYSGPSSMWVQGGPLTADDIANWNVAMRASFAGFVLPEGSTTDIQAALVPESALEDTNTPSLDDAVWYETLYASNLVPSNGQQPNQRVEAWQQLDVNTRYYLVTYSTDLSDRSYDSRLLLPIEGQEPDATPIEHATVEFGFNDVHQGASPAGGCNYFVAGTVQGLGSDYQSVDGNVYVVKKHADGTSQVVDVTSRCTPAEGSDKINQRFLFTEGEGQTDADGTTIQWTGAGTVNAYGGLVSWYFENPELELDANGDGQITARVGGFGSSMENPDVKVPLDPREGVVIADVKGATVTGGQITIDPVWKGVDYFPLTDPTDVNSERSTTSNIPQSAKDANPNWGSWPQSFVDFQYATGLSSYWHTSGLSADPLKPPMPITVALEGSAPVYDVLLTSQPAAVSIGEGDDATFSGLATAASGAVSYQWQAKKAGSEEWVDIAGATDPELTLPAVTVADWNGAAVRFVATSAVNSVASGAAALTVTAKAAPVFTTQPTDFEALLDQGAYISAQVTGYPLPSVSWESKAPDGEWVPATASSNSWVDGSTRTAYISPDATLDADGTQFRATAVNSVGTTVSNEVTLHVSTKPAGITRQPQPVVMFAGGAGYLYLGVEGAPYPTVTWEKSTDGGQTWSDAGLEGDFQVLDITSDQDGDQYRATVSNEFATVVSEPTTVQVLDADSGLAHVSPSTIDPTVDTVPSYVLNAQPAQSKTAGLFYAGIVENSTWQPGDVMTAADAADAFIGIPAKFGPGDWSYYSGDLPTVTAGTLDPGKEYSFIWLWVPNDAADAQPQFDTAIPLTVQAPAPVPTVTVSKTEGLDPNGETVTVTGTGFLPHAPETNGAGRPLSGFGGAYVVFGKFADTWQPSAGATSSARVGIDTKWGVLAEDVDTIGGPSRGAVEIKPDGTFETTLTVKSGAFDKTGSYGVYTYAGGGAVYAPFETATPVTLNEAAPAVTAQPSGITVPATPAAGDPVAVFSVGVSGAPAPTVQWQKKVVSGEWTDVAGATSTSLALPYAAGDDGVSVRAVVTNGLGSVTSDAAVLTVTPDPVDPTDPTDPTDPVAPSEPLTPLTDDELAAAPQGTVSILGIDGDVVTLSVGTEHAGTFVGTEVHSTPAFLGWSAVSSAGTTTATLPADLAAGEHHLVVRATDGSVIGWAVFTVADAVVPPLVPVDTDPAATTPLALPNTGSGAAGWLALALLFVLAGAGVMTARTLKRS